MKSVIHYIAETPLSVIELFVSKLHALVFTKYSASTFLILYFITWTWNFYILYFFHNHFYVYYSSLNKFKKIKCVCARVRACVHMCACACTKIHSSKHRHCFICSFKLQLFISTKLEKQSANQDWIWL